MIHISACLTDPGPLSDGTAAFPRPLRHPGATGDVAYENIVYAVEEGYRPLFLDLHVPASANVHPAPLIVWVHGGGWAFGSRRRQAPNLHRHRVLDQAVAAGFAVAVIDYRLIKESGFPAQVIDLRSAIRWIRAHAGEYDIDATRVALFGESAGAHIVLMQALAQDIVNGSCGEFREQSEAVQAVVEWYGPTLIEVPHDSGGPAAAASEENGPHAGHPLATLVETSDRSPARLSPINHVRADAPPLFIAHGREDQLVDVEQGRSLYQAMAEAGATVEYFETDGGHVFVGTEILPQVMSRSLDFIGRHLSHAPARMNQT